MSKIYKKCPDKGFKNFGDHKKYLSRITKTLYYGKLPKTDTLSLPVTELAAELFSEAQKDKSLERLHCYDAAKISRSACVSPCSLVLAMFYLERLKMCNPVYLSRTSPSDLFLVSLMVSSKYLFDDGESDEVFADEWAASGGISVRDLDWKIYISELTFWEKLNEMETTLAIKQGISRGHFTYTELQNLIGSVELYNLVNCIVAVSVILAATYTAGLLTLVSSVYIASQVPGTSLYARQINDQGNNFPLTSKNMEITGIDIPHANKTEHSKYARNLDIVDVFKTSILLATIKSVLPNDGLNNTDTDMGNIDNNAQYMTWDYWNIPVMDWLAKSSEFVTSYTLDLPFRYYPYFLETSISNAKCIELQDQIHKATKTRIQDQMESSWHEEWTDILRFGLFLDRLLPFYNIKS
ncbi:hypothetical protein NQ317_016914 [Molorchus minor]|uniref:Protein CNPPD1 n=1 Tax=Molorchus minor TaxID=1323400 RepID=A0ABQ9K3J7_9CUCU|nr:hypothetical protein NQ317_016914 [Molorchus minor]